MKKWSDKEIETIIVLVKEGKTYPDISNIINRTTQSIRMKLDKLGYYSTDYKIKPVENVKCVHCGKLFESYIHEKRQFCSQSCSAKYNNKNRNTKHCVNCGKPIYISAKYCSSLCNIKYNNLTNVVLVKDERFCLCCNTKITKDVKKISKFCSRYCNLKYNKDIRNKKIEEGIITNRQALRRYFLEKKGNVCEICGNTQWNNLKIPLVLDHINGNPYDNNLTNLRLICPNCDAQTPTYKGKNVGNGRHERMKRYNEGKSY